VGFFFIVNNVSWFRMPEPANKAIGGGAPQLDAALFAPSNLAAVYLLPLLAILAAGMLSLAVSDGFEWLYALRLVAALVVFYAYRRVYCGMDWRFGWLGPAAGSVVFVLWIALNRWIGQGTESNSDIVLTSVSEGLARLGSGKRIAWITLRTLTAISVVPLAEELAFRGYIARALISPHVEQVSLRNLTPVAILGSSLIFGILHGRLWFAGVLAGILFALVARRRGRLGEAVAAHAAANLLLAIWVIARGDYSLW
jgi:CAAX prenyl protease-like protein